MKARRGLVSVDRLGPVFAALAVAALAAGCGGEDETTPQAATVTLTSSGLGVVGDAVRLADGQTVANGGDVALLLGVQLSLQPPAKGNAGDMIFCHQGTFATLAAVSTDESFCAGESLGRWETRLFLSGASFHEDAGSSVIGLGALVLNSTRDALYRLRILGDSTAPNADGSLGIASATFEYERVR